MCAYIDLFMHNFLLPPCPTFPPPTPTKQTDRQISKGKKRTSQNGFS